MNNDEKTTRSSFAHEKWLIKQIEKGIENAHSTATYSNKSVFSHLQNKVTQQSTANTHKQNDKIASDVVLLRSLKGIVSGDGLTQGRNHNDELYRQK